MSAEWWSSLFVDMSPASFFNFSFLPRYGKFFLQGVKFTLYVLSRFTFLVNL